MEQETITYTIITTQYYGHCLAENNLTHEIVCLHEGCNLVSPERNHKVFSVYCPAPKGKMKVSADRYRYARHRDNHNHGALDDLTDPHSSSAHLADSHFPLKR